MRLIDADEFKIDYGFTWDDITPTHEEIYAFIDRQPTIDAVQVVMCKDCKHWNGEAHGGFYYFEECALSGLDAISDDYCSHAERKEDG